MTVWIEGRAQKSQPSGVPWHAVRGSRFDLDGMCDQLASRSLSSPPPPSHPPTPPTPIPPASPTQIEILTIKGAHFYEMGLHGADLIILGQARAMLREERML